MDQPHAATPAYDRTVEDVGNIVEFGHVNVRVPDQALATLFYVSGLGLTRDPYLMTGTDNMWINVGCAQFHLPTGDPQVLRGVVGIVVPDLGALLQRLKRVAPKLAGTRFAYAERDGAVEATCPWGNRIRLHAPDPRFGPIVLGMPYVELDAPPGSGAAIARFYREILDSPASEEAGGVRVGAGIYTTLRYRESPTPMPPFDGHHIQITLADFSGPHRRLRERGLVSEESDQHQYRFEALVDLSTGAEVMRVEHEVRSMRHPLFARPLVNRDATITNRFYSSGHDALTWSAAPA
jgi:catechol 2,3-dioxygenase-like lactoylglutathione lyase family enzyme